MLNFLKNHPKLKATLIVLIALLFLNTVIKFAIGVYFPWIREDWGFLPYTYYNENTKLKGGEIVSYNGKEKIVVIPRNVESPYAQKGMDGTRVVSISARAFADLAPPQVEAIEVIIVPEGIKKIEKMAFMDCENLKFIYLPMSIKEMPALAFEGITDATVISFNPVVLEALKEARN